MILEQNLAIFECFRDELSLRKELPDSLRDHLLGDLNEILSGFRTDLKRQPNQKLDENRILKETIALQEMLRAMSTPELAACAYLDIGGNAFGTHDLAEAVEKRGFTNTAGFTVYTRAKFMELVKAMNSHFSDSAQLDNLVAAGRKFFEAHERVNNSDAFIAR